MVCTTTFITARNRQITQHRQWMVRVLPAEVGHQRQDCREPR
jgi:hypothetical protein